MSNSYMGPKDPFKFGQPNKIYSPEDQWQSMKDERQQEIDMKRLAEKLAKVKDLEDQLNKAKKDADDKFEIGGAL